MSPRHNRRRSDEKTPRPVGGTESVQQWSDGSWSVRAVSGSAAVKTYRCPGCDQEIPPGIPHVVAWPADESGGTQDRRHWHSSCWQHRDHRRPTSRT